MAGGQRLSTLCQYEGLERALNDELGMTPSDEAVALRRQVIDDQPDQIDLVDRSNERSLMQRALDDAEMGSGSFILLSGPPGVGKSTLADWLAGRARQHNWLVGRSVAASVDGPWPYAPVLEAVDDLLRQAPALLDDLPATHRAELERVRHAPQPAHDGFGPEGHQRLLVAVDELVRLSARSRGLVLLVDDLHAADDASLALLHYIARQAGCERRSCSTGPDNLSMLAVAEGPDPEELERGRISGRFREGGVETVRSSAKFAEQPLEQTET
ncbi:MAG: ATP-binding protein [Actinomycetia bacterium]|nr:ATP-binding protein [Actinomycetes bacterium]